MNLKDNIKSVWRSGVKKYYIKKNYTLLYACMHSFIILLSVIIVVIDISIRAYLYIQCKVLLNKLRKAISTGSLFS